MAHVWDYDLAECSYFLETIRSLDDRQPRTSPAELFRRTGASIGSSRRRETLQRSLADHTAGVNGDFVDIHRAISHVNKGCFDGGTIGFFHGTPSFALLFLGKDSISLHIETCLNWLSTIGEECASILRSVIIVYTAKRHHSDISRTLLPQMYRRGVREGCVVRLPRIIHPLRPRKDEFLNYMHEELWDEASQDEEPLGGEPMGGNSWQRNSRGNAATDDVSSHNVYTLPR